MALLGQVDANLHRGSPGAGAKMATGQGERAPSRRLNGDAHHRQTKAPTPVLSLSSPSLDIAVRASSLTRFTTSDQGTST